MKLPALTAATLALAAFCHPAYAAHTEQIGQCFVHADGCHDGSQQCTSDIAHPDDLDGSYRGALAGIEVVTYTGSGRIEQINFTNNNKSVHISLYTKGKGHYVKSPIGGGGVCVGAAGGSYGVNIIAHYKN